MKWRNDIEKTEDEERKVKALQDAGCKCPDFPLLGGTPGKSFRCRICNIEISEDIFTARWNTEECPGPFGTVGINGEEL